MMALFNRGRSCPLLVRAVCKLKRLRYLICVPIIVAICLICQLPIAQREILFHKKCFRYYQTMDSLAKEVNNLYYQPSKDRGRVRAASLLHVIHSKESPLNLNPDVTLTQGSLDTLLGPVRIFTYGMRDLISRRILETNEWETPQRRVIEHLLMDDPDLLFIDFGANIGTFTLTAAKHGHQVLAVDANRKNLEVLYHSLKVNANFTQRVTLVHNALSNERGHVVVDINPNNIGGSGVVKMSAASSDSVDGIVADDLLSIIKFKRVVIKMDIEAFEHNAMAGATRLFEELDIRYVLMEWSGEMKGIVKYENFVGPAFLVQFFYKRGYAPYSVFPYFPLPRYFCFWPSEIIWRKVKS